ncbi:cell division protein FtsA [Desulforamulus aquiferis]|uniref:Cell division FtsA domain-containing protein n=1 Tax=Desulforamulus aquiferis TaxID=1397668 RepID=A0AAW7ZG55_9FIRM|nr:cell division FtsA domain-containing protein [Desulforamulus aquiferis]MDO7788001.1 cell division FtsA domain-containing protein [Desulforamulus aquiferis]RYD05464.1 hypothetical protein N752_08960 [Desulforamulus aquiferis]
MSRRRTVAGLDIGTTKIVAVIAEVGPNGYPIITGFGESPAIGVRRGKVYDSFALGKSIAHAVELAQDMTKELVKEVYITFPTSDSLTGEFEIIDESLAQCVVNAGLTIIETVHSAIASAEKLLTETDRKLGSVLIDLGGTTTGLAVYDQGELIYSHTIPIGSEHITSDLAVCLRTTLGEAERVKRTLGISYPEPEVILEISNLTGNGIRSISGTVAVDIIKSRVKEILELCYHDLKKNCRFEALSGGLVFTGGGTLLKDFLSLAHSQFPFSRITIGPSGGSKPSQEGLDGPGYTSSVGLVIYGAKRSSSRLEDHSGWRGVLARFR